ncbi:MAG TPA: carboxypeptidase-like regulatory domain-containing protein, partial [Nevskiaceae bacterium]|nr:carboxypeptidase-like regulatory domain-containing protein [Nevskiaceae bacterium]
MSGRSLRGRVGPALAAAAMVFASAQAAPPATTVEGHLLAGHVTLDGKALPGASVVLTSGGGGTFVRTDDSGAYAFRDLLDGDYTISVRLPGYGFTPPRRTLHLQDFDASSLDFDAVYIGAPPGSGIVVAPPPSTMPPAVAPAAPSAAAASVPAVPSAPPPAAAPPVQTPAPAYPSAPAPSITAAAPAAEALPAASAPAAAASASAPAPATPAASAAVSAPVAPIATPPPAPTAAAAEVTGHAYAKHGTGMGGVTVGYNMTRRPAVDARLPAVITGEDGSFTLPALPPHPAYEPQPWIEAHGPLFQYCPPQVFLPAPNPVEFRACDPPEPSKAPHQLSGSVTRLGKPLPRVEIHQAFSSRRGYTYEEGPLGPVVAYSDENGHWQFTAPSVSARNEVSGYFSYLVAVLPDGPRFCPGQLFLPEGAGNLDHLDFAACGAEGSLAVGSSRIAAAPASGSIQDVALALVHGDIAVAWVQDVGAISTVWFARWNGKSWSAPVAAANGHVADDPNHRLSLAAAGDHLALAYLDRDDALGTHVAVSLSDDGGHGWHGEPVATFVAHS